MSSSLRSLRTSALRQPPFRVLSLTQTRLASAGSQYVHYYTTLPNWYHNLRHKTRYYSKDSHSLTKLIQPPSQIKNANPSPPPALV